jgi:hypothetical protein
VVVRETIVRDGGSGGSTSWPTLTKTNYTEWAILMRVKLQAAGLWEAVDADDAPERQERQALGAILSSVPSEMVQILAAKDNAKIAWDTIKTMRVGVDRVREARRQKLRKDFDVMAFRSGENVEDFSLRVSSIITELQALGDTTTELDGVSKILRVVSKRYAHMACSIETLLNLKEVSIEELSGRLSASEGRGEPEADAGDRLLLTEEEWRARAAERQPGSGSGGKQQRRDHRQGGGKDGARSGPSKDDKCRYCGKKGHWARDCRKKKRDEGAQAYLIQGEDEGDPVMLLAEVVLDPVPAAPELPSATMALVVEAPPAAHVAPAAPARELVFLNEEKAKVVPSNDGGAADSVWFLDTGASNHMTGDRSAFMELDEAVHGSVKFGDGSVVQIMGRGTIAFSIDGGEHRVFSDVYYIPRLRSSVVSLGQLDELACDIRIKHRTLTIHDRRGNLIVKVRRAPNRLYKLTLRPIVGTCLAARHDTMSWRWHERFGHIHLDALQKMGREGMVRGLPAVEPTGELCQACLAGKQRRTPFPQQAKFRAKEPLELVHADLCGAISPPTPAGRRFFLLLVNTRIFKSRCLLCHTSQSQEYCCCET